MLAGVVSGHMSGFMIQLFPSSGEEGAGEGDRGCFEYPRSTEMDLPFLVPAA